MEIVRRGDLILFCDYVVSINCTSDYQLVAAVSILKCRFYNLCLSFVGVMFNPCYLAVRSLTERVSDGFYEIKKIDGRAPQKI